MKPFEPFPRPTQETDRTFSTETCISRSTFRSLSTDVQLDYARFYGLSDAGTLTADQICNSLFEETEWIPALEIEGHVRHTTAEGIIVAKDVMDLVDWLVLHHTESTSPHTRLQSPEESDVQVQPEGMSTRFPESREKGADCDIVYENDPERSHNNLQRVAEDLQTSHVRLRKSVEASRKALREACADIFILRGQLEEEKQHQRGITGAVTRSVGVEGMQRIQTQIDLDDKEHQMTRSGMKRKRCASKSNTPPSISANPPYHVLTFSSTRSRASSSGSPRHNGETVDIPSKRTHDDQNESNFEPHKRRRLDGYIPRTILTYTSDDKSDGTYSDSEGTERDFEDDDYSFLNSGGRSPRVELKKQSDLSSETDDSQGCMRWGSIPSFEDDPSDLDYEPPDWDLEDIWELGMANDRGWHPLFEFEYTEEIRECGGVLSNASLSTEDPDDGYNEVGKLRHFLMLEEVIFSQSLGPMLDIPKWVNRTNYRVINGMMFTPSEKLSKEQYKDDEWDRMQRMATHGFYPVDFEQRLDELLNSDHSQFYFDDDEWKALAPYPMSSHSEDPLTQGPPPHKQRTRMD